MQTYKLLNPSLGHTDGRKRKPRKPCTLHGSKKLMNKKSTLVKEYVQQRQNILSSCD